MATIARLLESLEDDARHGLRRWLATPLLTAISFCSLAVGMGATLAVFALIDAIYLRQLPVRDPAHLLKVGLQGADALFPIDFWRFVERGPRVFDGVAASATNRVHVRMRGQSKFVDSLYVSGNYFQVIGAPISMGRPLEAVDQDSVVISFALWQTALGGSAAAIGEVVRIGNTALTIVGIASPEFFGTEVGRRVDVYVPLAAEPSIAGNESRSRAQGLNWLSVFVRQEPAVSVGWTATALRSWQEGLRSIARPSLSSAPTPEKPLELLPLSSARSSLESQFGGSLWALFGSVSLVLLVVCVNMATIVMAKTADREPQIVIRLALGASNWSIVRGIIVESLVLTSAACVAAIGLALWLAGLALPSLVTPLDRGLQPYLAITLDSRLVAGAVVLVLFSTIACSLLPSLRILGRHASRTPAQCSRAGLQRPPFSKAILTIVGAQVAIALVLVSLSALFVKSFIQITSQPTAVDARGVILASIEGTMWRSTPAATVQHVDELVRRLNVLPSTERASISVLTPLSGVVMLSRVEVPGFRSIDPRSVNASVNWVTSGFFEVFGTKILSGRAFDDRDGIGAPRVAIVNEAFSAMYLAGKTPLGSTIKLNEQDVEIVGVVATGRYMNLREPTMRFVYVPFAQWTGVRPLPLRIGIRTSNPEVARGELMATVRDFDRDLALEFRNLKDDIDASANRERLLARLSGVLGFLALAIAATGLHGTFSFLVHRRRPELALRAALGADGPAICLLVARDVMLVVGLGSAAGFVGVWACGRFVSALLFGVGAADPLVVVASWVCLALVAAVATLSPVSRASRVDPMVALRVG